MTTKRVAIYARVSTTDQTTENQVPDLRRYASERGWDVVGEYIDEGISGTRASRPELDRMMDAVRKRKADIVLVWRFDRFARSLKNLILTLDELNGLGVDFISYQENLDTTSPLGRALFAIIGAMAELERNVIIERVHAGLQRARRQGKRIGRPRSAVSISEIRRLRAQGLSQRSIGRRLGVSYSTVCRMLQPIGPCHRRVSATAG